MLDMVNPGFLGSLSSFKRNYEYPIVKSKDKDATCFEKNLGIERSDDLIRITGGFVLRRTAATISDFLPPKIEVILFLKPNALQISLYKQVLASENLNTLLERHVTTKDSSDTLACIMTLRKISNSPKLILNDENRSKDFELNFSADQVDLMESGSKIDLLKLFLRHFKTTNEKVVIVSSFTQTLDLFQNICEENQYPFRRLDGKTNIQLRSKYYFY